MWCVVLHTELIKLLLQRRNRKGCFTIWLVPLLRLQEQLGQVCHPPQASLLLLAMGPA